MKVNDGFVLIAEVKVITAQKWLIYPSFKFRKRKKQQRTTFEILISTKKKSFLQRSCVRELRSYDFISSNLVKVG